MEFWNKLTRNQKIIAVAVVVALLLTAYFVFGRKKKNNDDVKTIDIDAEDVTQNDTFPLKKGKRGKRVEQLQMYLVRKYGASFPKWGVDGIWGDETDGNVQKFLKRDNVSQDFFNKLNVDGVLISSYVTNNFK
jgi:hypothetical protein